MTCSQHEASLCQMSYMGLQTVYTLSGWSHVFRKRLPCHIVTQLCAYIAYPGCKHSSIINVKWKKHKSVPTACHCRAIPVQRQILPEHQSVTSCPTTNLPTRVCAKRSIFEISCQRTDRWKGAETDNGAKISHLWSRGDICRCTEGGMMADSL